MSHDDSLRRPRLGDFELLRAIGRGGMGVVYEARQISLDRTVVLKFMIEHSLGDRDLRARFLREARMAAALNHQSICTVYEIREVLPGEEIDLPGGPELPAGTPYISMEWIDGRTLSSLIGTPELRDLDRQLAVAIQVAEALAAAHIHGIVHRDLKPGNVMVTRDGRVKIVDFGLAKPVLSHAGAPDAPTVPLSDELTREGQILGTVSYMSPEQAMGNALDARSDVFSFGTLLYEMVAGRRPFLGENPTSTLAKIIESEPEPVEAIKPGVPPELARIIRRCLRKRPDDRYNDTRDLVVALGELRGETASGVLRVAASRPVVAAAPTRRRWVWWAAGCGACAIFAAALIVKTRWLPGRSATPPPAPRHQQATSSGDVGLFDLSPDGRTVAYVKEESEGQHSLVIQDLAGGQPLAVYRGRILLHDLRWSPDGSTIVILGGEPLALLAVPRLGGAPRSVGEAGMYFAWSSDGARIAATGQGRRSVLITDTRDGSVTEAPVAGSYDFVFGLDWSPRAELLAVVTYDSKADGATVRFVGVDGRHDGVILQRRGRIYPVRWAPDGAAVYFRTEDASTNLWKAPVDPRTGTPAGTPVGLLAGIRIGPFFSVCGDGRTLAYLREAPIRNIWRIEAPSRSSGMPSARALTTGTLSSGDPALSPDGGELAFSRGGAEGTNIFTVPAEGGAINQMTFLAGMNELPVWSPDGRRIAFASRREGACKIAVVDVASGNVRMFEGTRASTDTPDICWAPLDRILYLKPGNRNFAWLDPDTGEERPLLSSSDEASGWIGTPRPSPDGRLLAVMWNRAPQRGIWLVHAGGSPSRCLYPTEPRRPYRPIGWTQDGSAVLVEPSDSPTSARVVRVPLDAGVETAIDIPFRAGLGTTADGRTFFVPRIDDTSDVWLAVGFDPDIR